MTLQETTETRIKRVWVVAVLAGTVAALALAGVVHAIANPDTIAITQVRAFDSVLEGGDLLMVVEYNLAYSSIPDEVISDAFLGRFIRSSTELKNVEPFAFNDKGYGLGIFSLYWSASEQTSREKGNQSHEEGCGKGCKDLLGRIKGISEEYKMVVHPIIVPEPIKGITKGSVIRRL